MHAESAVLHRNGTSLNVAGEQWFQRENTIVNMLVKTFEQQVDRYDNKVKKKCFTFNVLLPRCSNMIFLKDWMCLQRLLVLLLIALPIWQTDTDGSQLPYLYFCRPPVLLITSKSTRRWANGRPIPRFVHTVLWPSVPCKVNLIYKATWKLKNGWVCLKRGSYQFYIHVR